MTETHATETVEAPAGIRCACCDRAIDVNHGPYISEADGTWYCDQDCQAGEPKELIVIPEGDEPAAPEKKKPPPPKKKASGRTGARSRKKKPAPKKKKKKTSRSRGR